MKKAYLLLHTNINDREAMRPYLEEAPNTLKAYGGKYLVRGGETFVLEGTPPGKINAIVEFPNRDAAEKWYNSPEYQSIIHHRKNNSEGFLVILEEYTPPLHPVM